MSPTPFIACVEDDLHVSEAIKGLLEAHGFAVMAFAVPPLEHSPQDRSTDFRSGRAGGPVARCMIEE